MEGGREVREGVDDSSKGGARAKGIYVLEGERAGTTYESIPRTLWIPEATVALMVYPSLRPHCLAPGREKRAGSESMQESGERNPFSIRIAGKPSIRGFVS